MMTTGNLPTNEVMKLRPGALVSLYQLDVNPIMPPGSPPQGILHWVSSLTHKKGIVTFRGRQYTPIPILSDDFGKVGEGKLPRPRLQVSNIEGSISTLLQDFYQLTGARLTRLRTFEKYLDGEEYADPLKLLDVEVWRVGQVTAENRVFVEFELYLPFDLEGIMIPKHRITERCRWRYRDPDTCSYIGPNVDINGVKEGDVGYTGTDSCAKSLKACRAHFQWMTTPVRKNPVLPFGGYPGTGRPVR